MCERRCGRAAWIAAIMLASLFLAIGVGASAQPASAPAAAAAAIRTTIDAPEGATRTFLLEAVR